MLLQCYPSLRFLLKMFLSSSLICVYVLFGYAAGDCTYPQGSCYLYIHTTTRELRGTKPPEFVGPPLETGDTAAAKQGARAAAKAKARAAAAQFPTVPLDGIEVGPAARFSVSRSTLCMSLLHYGLYYVSPCPVRDLTLCAAIRSRT